MTDMDVETVKLPLVNLRVTPLKAAEVVDLIHHTATLKRELRIANLNLHALFLCTESDDYARFVDQSGVVLVDGWPILALARIQKASLTAAHRVGSTDWLDALLRDPRAIRVCAIGGTEETSLAAASYVARSFPHVSWRAIDGYGGLSREGLGRLHDALDHADLVLVGLGMPLQEQWIEASGDLLRGKIVANVGGCIDYLGGAQRLAPRWIGAIGFEWLYRLARSPRRLAYRYLVEPVLLLRNLVRLTFHRPLERQTRDLS